MFNLTPPPKKILRFLAVVLMLGSHALVLKADTVIKKNGDVLKGIVIEQYADRILFSTYKGELIINRKAIEKITFDGEVDNLINLAETYKARGNIKKAYYYYSKAFHTNRKSQKAKDGYMLLRGSLIAQKQEMKQKAVARRKDVEKWYAEGAPAEKTDEDISRERDESIKTLYGFELAEINDKIYVRRVHRGSPSHRGGIKKGDILVSLWGKMMKYMSRDEVMDLLAEHSYDEVKVVIRRDLLLQMRQRRLNPFGDDQALIGAKIEMLWDGLTITDITVATPADQAKLMKGDIIYAVNNKVTRYTPLKQAIAAIAKTRPKGTILTVRRNVSFWLNKEGV